MPPAHVVTLSVASDSDGTGRGPSDTTGMYQDDEHYLEKLGLMWAKDTRRPGGFAYRLDRLPAGYTGWVKPRGGDTKHVDRYLYGHPSGKHFRSNNEIYPHFKHLQDSAGSVGCPCTLCSAKKPTKKATSTSNSVSSASLSEISTYTAPTASSDPTKPAEPERIDPKFLQHLPQGRLTSDSPTPAQRRKQVDAEGTADLYRSLIDKLQAAGPESSISENVIDSMSPDWRAGNEMLHSLFAAWSDQPAYVPRLGEIVVFARNVLDEGLAWDKSAQTLRRINVQDSTWLDRPRWDVGIVAQTPEEPVSEEDVSRVSQQKRKNVTYSGFRIEPLSEPSSANKQHSKQHKYAPLHAIRPFAFWRECLGSGEDAKLPATLKHAMAVTSSLCIVGRYSFKGTWPHATLFARGLYLGPEMIMVGDLVRLLPKPGDQRGDSSTDVMVVTSIRLRFVDLDEASDDDYDNGETYVNCLHVCGRTFTLDPKRSFGGIAKSPATPGQRGAPQALTGYGTWFHVGDPNEEKGKLELPFQRVMGRLYEESAIRAWFTTPNAMPPPSSFQAVNPKPPEKAKILDLSQGFAAIKSAREYSVQHDTRIDRAAGKSWFWAETRIEQLDLHEINGRFVGTKDDDRTRKTMNSWRQALKVMDGKRGGVEAYHAARKQRQDDVKRRESASVPGTSWGLMAGGAQIDSTDQDETAEDNAEAHNVQSEDAMEVDDRQVSSARAGAADVIDLSAEDEDEDVSMID
ncbi:hypothetical protein DOTSEDRAFT_70375 [Dothistroma septosporum NZE10]|uniref:Cryptic loci regulator 2 N-terminal domain-containing protein n=1 Tax=Dothistroma septosporum (strain NZE10 / CBS 128990) TaxID=675120 RepID=N1PVH8_DOTSN|nr:hypothetical protein DOTSEDRAFT_70375 [Dothistroma septosporum NZE10]